MRYKMVEPEPAWECNGCRKSYGVQVEVEECEKAHKEEWAKQRLKELPVEIREAEEELLVLKEELRLLSESRSE